MTLESRLSAIGEKAKKRKTNCDWLLTFANFLGICAEGIGGICWIEKDCFNLAKKFNNFRALFEINHQTASFGRFSNYMKTGSH